MEDHPYFRRRMSWTSSDGAGVVHGIQFPGHSARAYRSYCNRAFGGDEIVNGDRAVTCLMCIGQENR